MASETRRNMAENRAMKKISEKINSSSSVGVMKKPVAKKIGNIINRNGGGDMSAAVRINLQKSGNIENG